MHERLSPKSGGTAKTLRNGEGEAICVNWNKNQCKDRDCKRLHVCNRVLKNGRVCGMRNHTGEACRK